MAAALLLVLFREIWGWDHNPKQLNSQQRGSHRRLGNAHGARDDLVEASCVSFAFVLAWKRKIRSLFRRKTGCRGWGCKQSRPLPRAVRAAKLCPRCSPSPGRELQIRRKKTIATIVATTESNVQKGGISGLVRKKIEISFCMIPATGSTAGFSCCARKAQASPFDIKTALAGRTLTPICRPLAEERRTDERRTIQNLSAAEHQ